MVCPFCGLEAVSEFEIMGIGVHVCEKAPKNPPITIISKDTVEQWKHSFVIKNL